MMAIDRYVKDSYAYKRLKSQIKHAYPNANIRKTQTTLMEGEPILVMMFDPGPTTGQPKKV